MKRNEQVQPAMHGEKSSRGPIILIALTTKQILEAINEKSSKEQQKILTILQNKGKDDAKEESELAKPDGLEYASQITQDYRATLENSKDKKDLKKMEYLESLVSYNLDGTMNVIPIDKTFCEDISKENKCFNYATAQKIADKKGYKLMTDYNDTDTPQEKQASDFYTLINLFNLPGETGDTPSARALFRNMSGCNSRYRTDTPYKTSDGKLLANVMCVRQMKEAIHNKNGHHTYKNNRVCGRKDME